MIVAIVTWIQLWCKLYFRCVFCRNSQYSHKADVTNTNILPGRSSDCGGLYGRRNPHQTRGHHRPRHALCRIRLRGYGELVSQSSTNPSSGDSHRILRWLYYCDLGFIHWRADNPLNCTVGTVRFCFHISSFNDIDVVCFCSASWYNVTYTYK